MYLCLYCVICARLIVAAGIHNVAQIKLYKQKPLHAMAGDNYYKSKIMIERYDRVDRNITSVAE